MKKTKIIIALLLVLCVLFVCCACGADNNSNGSGNANDSNNSNNVEPKEPDAATAMENFVKKLQAGNYVVDSGKSARTTAFSPELVYIDYDHAYASVTYAFITLNNETFGIDYYNEEYDEVAYVSTGNALDALEQVLPNYWIKISNGNMWELFYNDPEDPLHFTSKDETVKTTLLTLGNYNASTLYYMQDVNMYFDAEDPTIVRFTAKMDQPGGMVQYDDLDLTLEFGAGKSDARAEAWLKSPVYPHIRTSWTKNDVAMFDAVFMRDYGTKSVPFPKFTSYAMVLDESMFTSMRSLRLTDAHATEKDVEDYKAQLLEAGFVKAQGESFAGEPAEVYRLLLREKYRSYAQLYPYYDKDKGFVLEARRYNENPTYSTLAEVSEVVQKFGFAPIPDTDVFTAITFASDICGEQVESYDYYFDYDLYLPVRFEYNDIDKVREFLEAYGAGLAAYGFKPEREPGNYGCRYYSANSFNVFWFEFTELEKEGEAYLVFKDEKSLTPEEALAALRAHNIPEVEIFGDIGCRDFTKYRYEEDGFIGLVLELYQPYDDIKKVDAFLDSYVEKLLDLGYLPIDPSRFNSYKNYLYYNEDLLKYVAFSVSQDVDGGAQIAYDFVSYEYGDQSMMLDAIGR